MLGYYKNTRKEIVETIKKSPITDDGYYFCKKFKILNELIGDKLDEKYFFPREYFKNKICFTLDDIGAYLEKKKSKYDIVEMKKLDDYIYSTLKNDIENYEFNERIENNSFTLGELIDTAIFMYYNKNKTNLI